MFITFYIIENLIKFNDKIHERVFSAIETDLEDNYIWWYSASTSKNSNSIKDINSKFFKLLEYGNYKFKNYSELRKYQDS